MYAVIMAGGKGTRFWPRSRERKPKHLLDIIGDRTIIQETVDRIRPIMSPENTLIVTGKSHAGELMRQLGESRQVFCVTHLAQVAAKAHHHYSVSKAAAGERTVSRVTVLDRAGRIEEIARMLGGMDITTTTRKHARELLAQA